MGQSIPTQSSVSLTTTPEYLPISGLNIPSLHLSQSSRLHPSRFHKTTATIQVAKSYLTCLWHCTTVQIPVKEKHENKLTTKFPVSFQVQFKTVSTSYTVQVVSTDLQYYMLNSNNFHNCSSNHGCYLMHLRNQDQLSQTGGVHMSLSLSLRRQPTVSTPSSTVPSVPWRFLFLSLSALQYLYCQANHNASGFNLKITSQCKHPSSPTALAHYRTSGVQLLTSYLTNVATKPRSLTKQTRPSRLSCQRFSNVATKPRSPTLQVLMPTTISNVATKPRSPTLQVLMPTFLFLTIISRHDARLSSTTHCALRASRINYNLTNLSRCNSFS